MIKPLRAFTHFPAPYSQDHIVAHSDDSTVCWFDLNGLAEQWQQQLKSESEKYWAVHLPDSISYLSFLIAAWRLGRVPVIAAQEQNTELPAKTVTCPTGQGYVKPTVPERFNDNPELALILYTSGSSGSPVAISKTFSQLDAELQLLEQHWGQQIHNCVFTSTVSRQHMYGLPFGLLWPLVRGSAFLVKTILYLESLQELTKRFVITLISSPTQLDNLPRQLSSESLHRRVKVVFSAGAPLPLRAAQQCRSALGPVIEIYGSTETGAVAYREQTKDPVWQCLDGVTVSCDSDSRQLCVHSPALGSNAHLRVADTATVTSPTRFELLGRTDRIVKVGGKRIALTTIETLLANHPWVKEVKVVQLEKRKARLGAVIIFTPSGQSALIDQGRHRINRMLSEHIRHHIEPVAIPRYWRYLSKMPLNSQGKTSSDLLKTLFLPEQQPTLPVVLERICSDQPDLSQSIVIKIPETLFYFAGHFPGNPVLPGVVQIKWALYFAKTLLGKSGQFRSLEALKFQHIIQPGDTITLQLEWDSKKSKLHFRYLSADIPHSSGRMVLHCDEQ